MKLIALNFFVILITSCMKMNGLHLADESLLPVQIEQLKSNEKIEIRFGHNFEEDWKIVDVICGDKFSKRQTKNFCILTLKYEVSKWQVKNGKRVRLVGVREEIGQIKVKLGQTRGHTN